MNDDSNHVDDRSRGERSNDDAAPSTQWSEPDWDARTDDTRDRADRDRQPKPDGDEPPSSAPRGQTASVPWTAIVLAMLGVVALLAWGAYAHWRENSEAAQTQQRTTNFVPTVRTVVAKREDNPFALVLPGQTEAFETANIFARATGYISERRVDIGSRVKRGDLLAHITAPDLDQQLAQAEAQLGQVQAAQAEADAQVAQAKANLALQTTNLQRTSTLTQQGYATVQNQQTQQTTVQSDQASLATAEAGVKVAAANVRAQQATVDRLRALASFENVEAPFDGVITVRNIEVGDLVNADAGSGSPMFTIDRDDVLRIAVRVPQYSAQGVRDGLDAEITVPGIPDRGFSGKVARSSNALLYSSRTLTTEVDVPNPTGALRPGLFVNVKLQIPRTHPNVSITAYALIFDQHGMRVAVVEQSDHVKMRNIDIYRDLGTSVELASGLEGGETVVTSPPVDLADGSRVKVEASDEAKTADAQSPSGTSR
jgi:RND family efflux transporter MFP subunit